MKNSYKITLGILAVLIMITIAIGTSYSFFLVEGGQEQDNSIIATCFDIEFTSGGSNINLANTYPMEDAKGQALSPYTFTIKNTCTTANSPATGIKYDISLNTLTTDSETSDLPASKIKYELKQTTPSSTNLGSAVVSTKPDNLATLNPSAKTDYNIQNSYSITSGTLAPQASNTYELRLWIPSDACEGEACETEVMSKVFKSKILVYAYM